MLPENAGLSCVCDVYGVPEVGDAMYDNMLCKSYVY